MLEQGLGYHIYRRCASCVVLSGWLKTLATGMDAATRRGLIKFLRDTMTYYRKEARTVLKARYPDLGGANDCQGWPERIGVSIAPLEDAPLLDVSALRAR